MNETLKTPMSGADAKIFELLETTSKQYRAYKVLNDVVNIARKSASSRMIYPPTRRSLISGTFVAKGK